MRKLTLEDFIEKSKQIHKNRYDYSLVEYIKGTLKVKIKCKKCNKIFEQTPTKHLRGRGCNLCNKTKNKSIDNFIEKSNIVHKNKYDYSLVDYKNNRRKIKIICHKHGVFEQTPHNHIDQKQGCPKCNGGVLLNNTIFIKISKEVHDDIYNYSLVNYMNSKTKVKIICKKCNNIFEQTPSAHISGQGCPICNELKLSLNDFINRSKEIHNNKYDYSMVHYINNATKISILCPIHGKFEQRPSEHLNGCGCSKCKSSNGEKQIKIILKSNDIKYITQKTFDNCLSNKKYPLKFDFYLTEKNICIEYDGEQHFKSIDYWGGETNLKNIKMRDKIKNEYCVSNNIHLIRIPYHNLNNVENILKAELKVE